MVEVEPHKIYLKFNNVEIHKEKHLIIETKYPIPEKDIHVEISDFTMKDGAIKTDWCLPLIIVSEFGEITQQTSSTGNPKIKIMDRSEFDEIFNIFCYVSYGEKNTDSEVHLNKNEYQIKTKCVFNNKPNVLVSKW